MNDDQHAYWNGEAGERWRAMADESDAVFAPMARAAMDFARPLAGERVLDIGCGCGGTSLRLAERVAPGGSVIGLDLSRPMLDLARERAHAAGLHNTTFFAGDASTVELAPGTFDLLFSQFGVMFFNDPVATFAHLMPALAPQGRLVFRCWQRSEDNPFFAVPASAARRYVAGASTPAPGAPGPLAFADPLRVRDLLARAGFVDVTIEASTTSLPLGADVAAAVAFTARIGAAARVLEDATPQERPPALAAMRDALGEYATDSGGVALIAGTWLVSARPASA